MKQKRTYSAVTSIALVAAVAGCGGGGDAEAGSPTVFSVQPTTATMTARTAANGGPAAGDCESGFAGEFFVYGGAAPYRIDNTLPSAMVVDKTSVADRGGSFTVTFTGQCVSPALIIVVDKLDHQIVVTLNNNPA